MTYWPKMEEVENAFQPAREADAPERFAGRKNEVMAAYYGLLATGANIAVVGGRGVGKTSLARQIIQIGQGSNALLERLDLPHDKKLDFLCFYLACGRSVRSHNDLLERLLTGHGLLGDWISTVPKAKKTVESYSPSFKVPGISLGATTTTETTSEYPNVVRNIETMFTNAVKELASTKVAKDGILIVVDEFDQINDTTGFASFLKALSTNVPQVKFCIVGVAQDVQILMKEHASADRLFAGTVIPMPVMNDEELKEVIGIAELSIQHAIRFSEKAAEDLVKLAHGHPYMVHLVGKHALRAAYSQVRLVIAQGEIAGTLRAIAEVGADPVLEGRYKRAVAASSQRESVLKSMATAQAADGEVHTGTAYQIALQLGVDNASQYVAHLTSADYGGELVKVRERYYRFRDSLFRVYAMVRPRLYSTSMPEPA